MGICYIVGAGEFGDGVLRPSEDDLVIACDGGYVHCVERGLRMDIVAGDFDSLGYVPKHPRTVRLRPEKDDTDTGWAVKEGLKRGYREFVIYGGTGGRISHTLANIALLSDLAARGCSGLMIGQKTWYRVICNGGISFDSTERGYLSVFCLGDEAKGVFEEGLKYGLRDALLTKEYPLGVSNEFIGKQSRVSVREGTLLLIREEV